jgi:hypothetical protein
MTQKSLHKQPAKAERMQPVSFHSPTISSLNHPGSMLTSRLT